MHTSLAEAPLPHVGSSISGLEIDREDRVDQPGRSWASRWASLPRHRLAQAIGILLLVYWCGWMVVGFARHDLKSGRLVMSKSYYGVDFYRHIDRHARTLWNGGNPYADQEVACTYPSPVFHLFAWVNAMTPRAALATWLVALSVILVAGAWLAARTRENLGLQPIALPLAIAAVLFSTPALFAVDRGQCDPLTIAFIALSLPLMRQRSKAAHWLAGAILCLAPWTKVYPGLLIVGLMALKQWRVLAAFLIAGAVIGLMQLDEFIGFMDVSREHIDGTQRLSRLPYPVGGPCPWNHCLPLTISTMLYRTPLDAYALLIGKALAAAILLPLLGWVSWQVHRSPNRQALAFPYLLWVVALATFVPPVSNDYNLCALPIAMIAACDRRNSPRMQLALLLLIVALQPLSLEIGGRTMFAMKLIGLAAVGACIVQRAAEQAAAGAGKDVLLPIFDFRRARPAMSA